jgi:2-haloacid dehalogenase
VSGGPTRPVEAVFFDLFGTLLSLEPLDDACNRLAPGRGREIAMRWRARQLEISWLRTSMQVWADFDAVTLDALKTTLAELGLAADHRDMTDVAATFAQLPLRDGAAAALESLQRGGLVTGVLTNASASTLGNVLARTRLAVDHALSVDAVRRFKPHPGVYDLAVRATGLAAARIGFVTANGWDAAGAGATGFRVVWLRPDPRAVLPPVGSPEPMVAAWPDIPRLFLGRPGG